MKIKEYNLPEWAFLDAHSHLGDELEGRVVIIHIPSATVLEIFPLGMINISPDAVTHTFDYIDVLGIKETHIIVLHHSATLKTDIASIKEYIFIPAENWYKNYLDWEDKNIVLGETGGMN